MTVLEDTTFINHSDDQRFRVKGVEFSFHRQYAQVYLARLAAFKPVLSMTCRKKWERNNVDSGNSKSPEIVRLTDLVANQCCVIIGTIYKEVKLKSSVLRDISSSEPGNIVTNTNEQTSLLSPDDVVFLEDDVQRIQLKFSEKAHQKQLSNSKLVTGIVFAVLGYEPDDDRGSFIVEDFLFVEPQPERPIRPLPTTGRVQTYTKFADTGPWLALVSGLGFTGAGSTRPGHAMALQLLADWLRRSGNWGPLQSESIGVVRLLILGDSIRISTASDANASVLRSTQRARYLTRHAEAESVTAMALLDQWLATLPLGPGCGTENNGLSVHIIPGLTDPTSQLLPQQPIHASAFPLSVKRSGAFKREALCGQTNPCSMVLEGRKILATAGQGPNDLALYTDMADSCERMEATLLWGHLAPTCPDTLPGYPMISEDLLVLRSNPLSPTHSPDYPDIYVAGCQPGQDASWRRASLHWKENQNEGALLIAVPRFDVSFKLVLVHLHTLDCRVVNFDTTFMDDSH